MTDVVFCTNIPSPYRVDFFNELGKLCKLTVCYERESSSERDRLWKGEKAKYFKEVQLNIRAFGTDRSIGTKLGKYLIKNKAEIVVLTNYSSPSTMLAILKCQFHKIPYCIEYDGGFDKTEGFFARIIKRKLLRPALAHLTTCDNHVQYLIKLGINKDTVFKYPFSSVKDEEVFRSPLSKEKKSEIRKELGLEGDKIVVSVGQFIYRKGFDVLIRSMRMISHDISFYIIGGEPSDDYISLKHEHALENLHFISFKSKTELRKYYSAADLFVLPTREDVWGLVVNEAMAVGLPVVSTERCNSAKEMINEKNGYIVPIENEVLLANAISEFFTFRNQEDMSRNSLLIAKQYTIERMASENMSILDLIVSQRK